MDGRAKIVFAALLLPFGFTLVTTAQQSVIPAAWHQPLNPQELSYANRVIAALRRSPTFPKVAKYHIFPGASPEGQINAWEQNMEIFVPVEMFRFIESDATMFEFLLAHEAGHARQQEIYGQNCYAANNIKMSKFDWVRALGDVVGGAATDGASGALRATAIIQKQACEDNADAWAVKFMREAGLDPNGGISLFTKLSELENTNAGWRYFTQQFTSDHSIDVVRIAHITTLILQGK